MLRVSSNLVTKWLPGRGTSKKLKFQTLQWWHRHPYSLSQKFDIIISILANDYATERAYFGEHGIYNARLDGKIVIKMCTVQTERAKQLCRVALRAGGALLECAVGGTVKLARDGALGEAVALLVRHNIKVEQVYETLKDCSGAIGPTKARQAPIIELIKNGKSAVSNFAIDQAIKDMNLMKSQVSQSGVDCPIITSAADTANLANDSGWIKKDISLLSVCSRSGA